MEEFKGLKMPDEILNYALEQEKKTHNFYSRMAINCRVTVVRELIEQLKEEEYKHIKLIEGMLIRLRSG